MFEAVLHGRGGFEKPVALKMLRPGDVHAANRTARLREARICAPPNHPNVAGIYAVDADGDEWRVAMELVRGATVRDLLGAGPLAAPVVLDIGLQTAAALANVHEAQPGGKVLVHRDVSPGTCSSTGTG